MKLIRAQVLNFRSIEDSTEFPIDDLTCLVGKNEAGKSALLQALYGLAPVGSFAYDKTRDYPRRFLSRFNERHPDGRSLVARTWWRLSDADKALVAKKFGAAALTGNEVSLEYGIGYTTRLSTVPINTRACLDHLIQTFNLDQAEQQSLATTSDAQSAAKILEGLGQRSECLEKLLRELKGCRDTSFSHAVIDILEPQRPKFFYTSHFDRMSGEVSLTKLAQDRKNNALRIGDQIFLDFIEYAGTTIEDLQKAAKYEDLKAQCEAASNDITDEIFQFWSQNEALEVKIELGEGRPQDPPPFNSGTVAKIRIENRNHRASVPLSERSAGFVWFFSFLAQFKQLKKTSGPVILLLDEPGLTLHGKAQSDLLHYIEDRLLPQHQVIYTTHSPFIVPTHRMQSVRVVEDVVRKDQRTTKPIVDGTKVSTDVLRVDKDTLFPLQGALGYEISQSLFVGKNVLLVEGPSDILYIQSFSEALRRRGRPSLDSRWTICPAGGIDKISPFVSLFSGNGLNIAVLCDLAHGDKGKLERLKRSQILKAGQLHTAADFTGKTESDVEDFLHPALYAQIVNAAFGLSDALKLDEAKLLAAEPNTERIVKKAEAAFRVFPTDSPEFDHFAPAQWLLKNPGVLDEDTPQVSETLDRFKNAIEVLNACLPNGR